VDRHRARASPTKPPRSASRQICPASKIVSGQGMFKHSHRGRGREIRSSFYLFFAFFLFFIFFLFCATTVLHLFGPGHPGQPAVFLVFASLAASPTPVVARVNGAAMGSSGNRPRGPWIRPSPGCYDALGSLLIPVFLFSLFPGARPYRGTIQLGLPPHANLRAVTPPALLLFVFFFFYFFVLSVLSCCFFFLFVSVSFSVS